MAASGVLLKSLGNGVIVNQFGAPLSGHAVFVYQTGTTTQVQVYSDLALSVPVTQPLTTGSDGTAGSIPGYVAGEQGVDFFDQTANVRVQANPMASADFSGWVPGGGGVSSVNGRTGAVTTVPLAPLTPTFVNVVNGAGGECRYLCVDGKYAYVSCEGAWFFVIDISTPGSEAIVGSIRDVTNLVSTNGVAKSGDYVYVAQGVVGGTNGALTVMDVSDPASPTVAFHLLDASFNTCIDVAIAGHYAFVANQVGNTITVVDISNPLAPTVISTLVDATNLASLQRVAIRGKFLWCACVSRITAVNISNPLAPTVAGSLTTGLSGSTAGLAVAGRYIIFTSNAGNALYVIDGKNPTSPTIVGSVTDATKLNLPLGVAAAGRYAYTVNQTNANNFTVVDLINPASPTIVANATSATAGHTFSIAAPRGRYLYAAAADGNGLAVIDIGANEFASLKADSLNASSAYIDDDLEVGGIIRARHIVSPSIPIPGAPRGLTGATAATRYVGATASGAPASGSFLLGDFVIDQTAKVWVCTTAGTPGTWTQAGGGSANPARIDARLAAMGFTDQNFDAFWFNNQGGLAPATTRVTACLVGLVAGDVVTNIFMAVATAGSGTAPTGIYLGLYSSALSQLAVTPNLAASTIWTAAGDTIVSAALTTPYTVTTTGGYYIAHLQNGTWGTTALTLGNCTVSNPAFASVSGKPPIQVYQSGQSTLPGTITSSGSVSPIWWFGWS